MTRQELLETARIIEAEIAGTSIARRQALQPQVNRIVQQMRQGGLRVPSRLRRFDAELTEELVEARFDNMPV